MHFIISLFSFQDDSLIINILSCIAGLFIIGIPLLIVLAIFYWIVDAIGFAKAPYQYDIGTVTNKYYKGESTHIGYGITTGGHMAVTRTHDDAEYIIEYKSSDGKKHRIETNPEDFDALEIGDGVKAYYKISTTTQEFKWSGDFEKAK